MAEAGWMQQHGVTPGKLAIVGVLALVLLVVTVLQLGGDAPPTPVKKRASTAAGRSRTQADKKRPAPVREAPPLRTTAAWPALPVEEVVQHDPFALCAPLVVKTAPAGPQVAGHDEEAWQREQRQQQQNRLLETLRQEGVGMIVVSGEQKVATIGQRRLRVGDLLEGLRVMDINSHGVVFIEAPYESR